MITIPAQLIRFADKIDGIDDEREQDNGYWIYLKKGWINPYTETHSIHEDTLEECATYLKDIEVCTGPCCRN